MIVNLKSRSPLYPDLCPAHPYFVIGIEASDYRILNDGGKRFKAQGAGCQARMNAALRAFRDAQVRKARP